MKDVKLDFSKLKHVKSDDKTTTLQHRDGHTITLSRKALSKQAQAQLDALAKGDKHPKEDQTSANLERKAAKEAPKNAKKQMVNDEQHRPNDRPNDRPMMANGGAVECDTAPISPSPQMYADGGPIIVDPSQLGNIDPSQIQINSAAVPVQPAVTADTTAPQPQLDPFTGTMRMPYQAQPDAPISVQDVAKHGMMGAIMGRQNEAPPSAPATQIANEQQSVQGIAPSPELPAGDLLPREQSGFNQALTGLSQEAKAKQQMADASAKIRQDQQLVQQEAQNLYQKNTAELETERKALLQDINDGHISPEKFWTGDKDGNGSHSKIATGIGMILAGFNPTTRPNAAIDFLKFQMEQNLSAQAKNLDSKQNLLRANLQQFGNIREATQMTRVMQNDMMANQLEQAAAKAANPMAKAQLNQAAGKLKMEAGAEAQKLAGARTAGYLVNTARENPAMADRVLQQLEIVDPKRANELRQVYVPGMGFASSNEGAKGVREMQSMVKSASDDIARLKELNKKGGKVLSPKLQAEADTIRSGLIGKLRVPVTGPGAMSDGERAMLEKMIPDVTAMFALDSSSAKRLDTLTQRLNNSLNNMATINGLKPQAAASGPEEGARGTTKDGRQVVRKGGKWVPIQ